MTAETRAASADLLAVLSELYPHRTFDPKKFPPELIAAVVLARREHEMLRSDTKTFTKLKTAYAEGAEPRLTVKPSRGKKGPSE